MPYRVPARRRIAVLFNPTAGRQGDRRLLRVLDALARAGAVVELRPTAGPGAAGALAREAAAGGVDAVAVAGGDGTIADAAAGLAGGTVPLGIVPTGTVNVLAIELGIPKRLPGIVETLLSGRVRHIHLGRVGERRFVMMASAGFDADAVAALDLRLKRRIGRAAYLSAATSRLAWAARPGFRLRLDGVEHRAAGVVVANGPLYGGGFVVAPGADLAVPGFQACLLAGGGIVDRLRYAAALALGRLPFLVDVRLVAARRVELLEPAGAPVQADGDLVARLPAVIDVAPETLPVLVPGRPIGAMFVGGEEDPDRP